MKRNNELADEPGEVITVFHCRGCEQFTFPADLDENSSIASSQLCCPRCGTKASAGDFFDYVNYEVAEYE